MFFEVHPRTKSLVHFSIEWFYLFWFEKKNKTLQRKTKKLLFRFNFWMMYLFILLSFLTLRGRLSCISWFFSVGYSRIFFWNYQIIVDQKPQNQTLIAIFVCSRAKIYLWSSSQLIDLAKWSSLCCLSRNSGFVWVDALVWWKAYSSSQDESNLMG